jgi:hypothetical protein
MAKYSKGAQKAVKTAMKRMEKGKLETGKSGKKVTNPKQAIAIGLSEARKKGAKVPVKKALTKKAAPKKIAVKKAVKKIATKKPIAKKVIKKAAPKKAASKKIVAKKVALKKTVPVKAAVKKAAAPKKVAVKKVNTKKTTTAIIPPPPEETVIVAVESVLEQNLPPVGEQSPVIVPKVEDPLLAEDKRTMIKATTKSDPKSKIHLSQNKSTIKPSGKKPLW